MFLGIIMDSTLSWKSHAAMIALKLGQVCYIEERNGVYHWMSLR
jgi:hypothetical protein